MNYSKSWESPGKKKFTSGSYKYTYYVFLIILQFISLICKCYIYAQYITFRVDVHQTWHKIKDTA